MAATKAKLTGKADLGESSADAVDDTLRADIDVLHEIDAALAARGLTATEVAA